MWKLVIITAFIVHGDYEPVIPDYALNYYKTENQCIGAGEFKEKQLRENVYYDVKGVDVKYVCTKMEFGDE